MGKRLANEMLLLDKVMDADEAKKCGFVNDVIDLPKGDFFDY